MQAYGSVQEDLPERVMRIAEREQRFRHELDTRDQAHEHVLEERGQWMALVIVLCTLVVVVLVAYGASTSVGALAASVIGGATVVGLAVAFLRTHSK